MSNPNEVGVVKSEVSGVTSKLCLLTDDSPVVRKIARRVATKLGFEVDEAEDGKIALEKCQVRMPNIVLLDWNMPNMNGIEFLRALRNTEGGKVPTVVFCTTESDVEHIREAIDSGADEYLMKPFDSESLSAKFAGIVLRQ